MTSSYRIGEPDPNDLLTAPRVASLATELATLFAVPPAAAAGLYRDLLVRYTESLLRLNAAWDQAGYQASAVQFYLVDQRAEQFGLVFGQRRKLLQLGSPAEELAVWQAVERYYLSTAGGAEAAFLAYRDAQRLDALGQSIVTEWPSFRSLLASVDYLSPSEKQACSSMGNLLSKFSADLLYYSGQKHWQQLAVDLERKYSSLESLLDVLDVFIATGDSAALPEVL